MTEESDRIPTNIRTLLILEALSKSDHPLTATEINQEIGLPKQTVHRLCNTLVEAGFLTQQSNSKRYQPARRLRDVSAGLLDASRMHIARHQILVQVAREVNETVNFVVPEKLGMSYTDRVETAWPFRIQLPIGTHVPFHCTASGKCFLACMPPRSRRAFLASMKLEKLTDQTHTDPNTLLAELKEIAAKGYSLDRQEFLDGMIAIAVPVTDHSGRFVAALAIHGPLQRLSFDVALSHLATLQGAANKIREAIFSPNGEPN
ncbi:IclR family transcriptional regulator [Shimia abyssi]|uniref:IclR family transcriptional regulator n=1 Tax=Shimia abyssi TaxID=1662395 RepID=UPI001FAF4540|nr:IclR family transcriptional regulator [Shimia abyssi]